DLKQVKLEEFTDRMIKKFIGIAEDNDIHLHLTQDIGEPTALFDHDQIEQVFTNLIDNAISHTNEKGEVHVIVKSDNDHIYVDIQDSGSGTRQEDLPFIFERFYRPDKSVTRHGTRLETSITFELETSLIVSQS